MLINKDRMHYSELKNTAKYELLYTIEHENIKEFLKENIPSNNLVLKISSILSIVSIFVLFAIISFISTRIIYYDARIDKLIDIFWGVLFSFSALIIIHELIHAFAYKIVGAKNVYFGAILRKFVFFAASDKDVINARQFRFVAMAPLVFVSCILIIISFIFPVYVEVYIIMFCLHNLFCSGDIIFLSILHKHRRDNLHTFDIKELKTSYIYRELISTI